MINIEISIQELKNEIAQIQNELVATRSVTDNERREAVDRLVEKTTTLLTRLSSNAIKVTIK